MLAAPHWSVSAQLVGAAAGSADSAAVENRLRQCPRHATAAPFPRGCGAGVHDPVGRRSDWPRGRPAHPRRVVNAGARLRQRRALGLHRRKIVAQFPSPIVPSRATALALVPRHPGHGGLDLPHPIRCHGHSKHRGGGRRALFRFGPDLQRDDLRHRADQLALGRGSTGSFAGDFSRFASLSPAVAPTVA